MQQTLWLLGIESKIFRNKRIKNLEQTTFATKASNKSAYFYLINNTTSVYENRGLSYTIVKG